jgi:hypothetical protein
MTDNLDTRLPQENTEKKLDLIASFTCPACASGAEKYSELFDHGTCVNCGNPLEQFSATLTETGEKEIKSSLLLIYSKDDMAKMAEDVTAELKRNRINIVDVHDIIDGSQTSVVSANLSFVMDKTAGVLVIPSQHLEDNPVVSTCLNNAIIQKVENSKKLIPIYTEENISVKAPFGLTDTVGINWDGKVDNIRAIVDKERSIDYLHQLADENTSK